MKKRERILEALRAAQNSANSCCEVFKTTKLDAVWDLRDGIAAMGPTCKIARDGAYYSLVYKDDPLTICIATAFSHIIDLEETNEVDV